jgi:hypothetical protein
MIGQLSMSSHPSISFLLADAGTACPGTRPSPLPYAAVPAGWGDKVSGAINYLGTNGAACGTSARAGCDASSTKAALTHYVHGASYPSGTYLLYDPGHADASPPIPAGAYCDFFGLKAQLTIS